MSVAAEWRSDDPWSIFSLTELAHGGVDAYLQMVAEKAAAQFRASGASIFLGEHPVYRVRARAGKHSTVPANATVMWGEGVAGRVVAAGAPRLLGDLADEPEFRDLGESRAVASSMVLPLSGPEGEVIGVLNLSRHEALEPFVESDLDRARAVAVMVGLSVANARLVERLRGNTLESERLRRLAEIGQLTAAVAHEMRNPLTGIRSAAQMVRENPDLADEFLGLIEDEVMKLNELCEEFLAFAKPLELVLQETSFLELLDEVHDLLEPEFDLHGVHLAFESEPNLPTMNLDRRRTQQVLYNLLRNARQACRAGGRVNVSVDAKKLVVQDDGVGMSELQMERLFTPFFTTKPDGTGLGLSNVRRIVEAHGWIVRAESELGQGSKFIVEFDRSES